MVADIMNLETVLNILICCLLLLTRLGVNSLVQDIIRRFGFVSALVWPEIVVINLHIIDVQYSF